MGSKKVQNAMNRSRHAALGAGLGAGVGGLFSKQSASTGAAFGAFVGVTVGEFRQDAAERVSELREKTDAATAE